MYCAKQKLTKNIFDQYQVNGDISKHIPKGKKDLNIIFYFNMSKVISQGYFKHCMEGDIKIQEQKNCKNVRKKARLVEVQAQDQQKKQISNGHASEQNSDGSKDGSGWSSEVIQPAIKTMSFRPKRGTRMKQLIKGKHKNDLFWDKYQNYFGGNLNQPDDSEDEEDYEASSSGRDQFDSDFDLTDSYVGKRGRKKGTKVKRRKKPITKAQSDKQDGVKAPRGRPGRKKKVVQPVESQQKQKQSQQLNSEQIEEDKKQERSDIIMVIEQPHKMDAQIVQISSQHQCRRETKSSSKKKSKNGSEVKISTPKQAIQSHEIQQKLFID